MSAPAGGGAERPSGVPGDDARLSAPTHPMISPHSARGARREEETPQAGPRRTDPGRTDPGQAPPQAGSGRNGQAPPPQGPPVWDGPPPTGAAPARGGPLERARALFDRISIRWRLTITYGLLFFLAGMLLVFVIYMMVGWAINEAWPGVSLPDAPLAYEQRFQQEWLWWKHAAIDEAREALLSRTLLALVGVGILAIVIGYVVADRALRPIQQMTATARRLSGSTLAHERIALKGPDDELKELADTFDAMLTRLNVAFDTQRRFVANASHELRTPLTINRTVLEIALGDPEASEDLKALGRTLLEVNARNERLIEGLLLLARSERELSVRKPVDMRDVARTAVEQLAPVAEAAGVTVSTELQKAETVGDPVLLERCVSNLVENAIKHNLSDSGHLWVRAGIVEGVLIVQVANTGPHVPAYEVNSLFEPFRRLNADRVDSSKGAGLGLSIVRAVVRAHGGDVTAVPRDGGGLVVTVRLQPR
ncbi:sensor protein CutS [Streptosporangium pseudovulgare]|uniref:histidine kinase n=2 Tax=Streptosporangium pseudovulgare TaxID=35765 RepID=A0ABQ2QJ41_9ACTN|nr:HAMP domain-containing sensor histidine kinase [Streptosporangium pseudovulgare]GGP84037.1 sensor protein CutS [Streptosporangium pseudovulgare]